MLPSYPSDSTYLWWNKTRDSSAVTFFRDSLYVVGGSLSVDCSGALKHVLNIDNRFSATTDTVIKDTARATKLIIVDRDPSNALFEDTLRTDRIRAVAWQEYAGSADPAHCHEGIWSYNPQWNNYWDNVITGADTCFETRYPCENIGSTATGTMQMLRGTWEKVFKRSGFIGEPSGYFVCKWDSLAWNWKINVFNGKYVHQTSMFSHMTPEQQQWDSLYFPQNDYTPDSLNREDLATYGYELGATEMGKITTQELWDKRVKKRTYIVNVRKYKDIKPWQN